MDPLKSGEPEKAKSGVDRSDVLYIAGAVFVIVGCGLDGPDGLTHALIAAGAFCLLLPGLQLLSGFIRGVRK